MTILIFAINRLQSGQDFSHCFYICVFSHQETVKDIRFI